jgi:hypothetical protein
MDKCLTVDEEGILSQELKVIRIMDLVAESYICVISE